MCLLKFHGRHRYPGGFELDMTFDVDHRFTCLFGPSGSGKTSVLAMIAGFFRPQFGKIELAGRTVLDTDAGTWVPPERRRVGMVFQDSLLFPHLSVESNLRYGQRHRRARQPAVDFSRVVEVLEIGELLPRRPRNLSGGERQRVALGRALLSGPEILLMDEPLASLDARLKARVLAYLERVVAEWDIPTLFVTHAQAEVRRAAQWVVMIDNGKLLTVAPPGEALSRPESLSWGNSAGPVNLLRLGEVKPHGGHLEARIGDQVLFLPPGDAAAGTPSFVQFSPADVILSRHDVTGLSARNHLQGRVCRIITVEETVFVAVDIGQVIWAEITSEAAAELELQTGSDVTCLLKVHSMQLVD